MRTDLMFLAEITMAIAIGTGYAPGAVAQAGPSGDEALDLAAAVALALQDNPGIAEMGARAEAMAAVPAQEATLPDPTVSIGMMSLPTDSFSLRREPMAQVQIGVSQMIPFPGKLGLREAAANSEAAAALSSVAEARLQLVSDVKSTWWELQFLNQATVIVERNQDLLRQFVAITTTKYAVGQGLQQDVLLAQVELSKLLNAEIQLDGIRGVEVARLNALLNRPIGATVAVPAIGEVTLPALPGPDALYEAAQRARPALTAQRQMIEAARSRVRLAERDLLPDFEVAANYGFRAGNGMSGGNQPDLASVMVAMNVPIFAKTKQRRAIDQRHAEVLEESYALDDQLAGIRQAITAASADYERARRQAELFEQGIIPQAQQTVASMLAAYQVNSVDFLNLVNTQVMLYDFETQYWKAVVEAEQARARLEAAIGEEQGP